MKIAYKKVSYEEADLSIEEILEAAKNALKKDADLDYQWINSDKKLEREFYTSHSTFEEVGDPSEKQLYANELINQIKDYIKNYLQDNKND